MAVFDKEKIKVPAVIGGITIVLKYPSLGDMGADIRVEVLTSGEALVDIKRGSLLPYLTGPEKVTISGFLVDIKQRAYNYLIGG